MLRSTSERAGDTCRIGGHGPSCDDEEHHVIEDEQQPGDRLDDRIARRRSASRQKPAPPAELDPAENGTLSYHVSGLSHLGQCDGGETSDSSRGSRQTTTFRKLPMHAPSAKRKKMDSDGPIGASMRGRAIRANGQSRERWAGARGRAERLCLA